MAKQDGAPAGGGENIAYSVRVSKRARRVSLRVTPGKGLEIVLPLAADAACVPGVIERHRAWIERALRRMPLCAASGPQGLPPALFFSGGNETVHLAYPGLPPGCVATAPAPPAGTGTRPAPPAAPRPVPPPDAPRRVSIRGNEPDAARAHLREWLRREALARFAPRLAALAARHGFTYRKVSVRFQKSRWGSCSAKGCISLNAALLFLPEPLSRYILLHELCHTRQMNHSERFWKELFAVEPDALALDRAMRRAWRLVPPSLY